ncbi:hypothetical protein CAPTEDRAFT_202160 [Capitella teleta]|uniref:Tyrosine specific protein phosphatases domain-containing protein n=1 Tax=Capitella teleta TaxID=283909 RepID=R7U464_CAPTE|nr:hypothetical protein CAPTEDRAFT_202160 [Capitella teleta]|eukprot:ELU00764.1 hypothetical protein CAPTEDRAFT_202160 [Capitella teleta]
MRVLVILCTMLGVTMSQTLGAFPQRKSWWAKRIISRKLYTAGRLTSTQLKQAANEGFKSVVSLGSFIDESSIGPEILPNTTAAKRLVESFSIMSYDVIEDGDVMESLESLTYLMQTREQPTLFHCKDSAESTFISLLYLLNNTLSDSTFRPSTSPEDVFTIGDSMGYYYRQAKLIGTVSRIANMAISTTEQPVPKHPWYQTMWWLRPIADGIFLSGQIKSNYLPLLEGQIKTYINLRRAAVNNGNPDQEEVTLLNVRDRTSTYAIGGRQSETRLRNTRLNVSQSNDFIFEGSDVNYQRVNELEYGDHIGYNESIARSHITQNYAFEYLHTPVGAPYGYEIRLWEAYSDIWLNVKKPVVFQCRTGYRSAVVAVMTLAYKDRQSSQWALNLTRDIGYPFSNPITPLFRRVLDNRPNDVTEGTPPEMDTMDNANESSHHVASTMSIMIIMLSLFAN